MSGIVELTRRTFDNICMYNFVRILTNVRTKKYTKVSGAAKAHSWIGAGSKLPIIPNGKGICVT